jgi:threonine/homoserine/homoserine lactone efflux protein
MFTSADIVCVFLAGVVATRLKGSARMQRTMQRIGGTILVGLGLNLAFQKT